MTRIVFTGGGTGGHIIPNIALIQTLKKRQPQVDILYIGSSRGPEAKMIPEIGVKFKGVATGKLRRYFSFANLVDIFRIPVGIVQSYLALRSFKPAVVFSKGGYVGIPVVYAAHWLKIPIVLHESDASSGLANRMAAKKASVICLSYEESKHGLPKKVKKVVTGNPVREFIYKGDADRGFKMTGFNKLKPVVLVMGGSQGAAHINKAVVEILDDVDVQFVHITGAGKKVHDDTQNYKSYEYINEELPDIYAISSVVLSRSGANSLAEIDALGLPSILVPLGSAASRGEQTLNAEAHKKIHPNTIIIENNKLDAKTLKEAIEKLFKTKREETNQNKAADKIIDVILDL